MGIDINKIIAEATQDESANDKNIELMTESVESDQDQIQDTGELDQTPQYEMNTNHCMASAISAGLGAMTFRNHLRSLTEISDKTKGRLKTAAKVVGGVGAAGVAGVAAYKNQEGITKAFKTGVKSVKSHFANKEDSVKTPNVSTDTEKPSPTPMKTKVAVPGTVGSGEAARASAAGKPATKPGTYFKGGAKMGQGSNTGMSDARKLNKLAPTAKNDGGMSDARKLNKLAPTAKNDGGMSDARKLNKLAPTAKNDGGMSDARKLNKLAPHQILKPKENNPDPDRFKRLPGQDKFVPKPTKVIPTKLSNPDPDRFKSSINTRVTGSDSTRLNKSISDANRLANNKKFAKGLFSKNTYK